jgi:hypothetical protein
MHFLPQIFGSVFLFSLTLNASLIFGYVWVRDSRLRRLAILLTLSGSSIVYLLLILEFGFGLFFLQSDNLGYTLASKRWSALYWQPINSLGYRDIEHPEARFRGRNALFVVGDSFVAGMGMADPAKRFPDVLQKLLGEPWVVVNIGMNGWNTANELDAIENYPRSADIIVLSYYVNDIEGAAWKAGLPRPVVVEPPKGLLGKVVDRSYLFNFLYWRLFRFRNAEEMTRVYSEYVGRCYGDDRVWQLHSAELQEVVELTQRRNSKLIVLIIPDLTDVTGSRFLTTKVASLFRNLQIRVVDLTDRLERRDVSQLVANRFDAHPSESLHNEIATVLLGEVRAVENGATH